MRIGYANEDVRRVCEDNGAAAEQLPAGIAGLLPRRLSQLAAFARLSDVPWERLQHRQGLPNDEPGAARYAILIDQGHWLVFSLAGEYQRFLGGAADLATVTSIEIVAVEGVD